MADLFISYDPAQPVGQRLAPEVRAEIATVAPSTVNNGSITAAKLAPNAVVTDKIADGAVTSAKIADGTIVTGDLADSSVTNAKIANGSVTPSKVAAGVVTAYDASGNPLRLNLVPITSAKYAALATPDPNTLYLITDGTPRVMVGSNLGYPPPPPLVPRSGIDGALAPETPDAPGTVGEMVTTAEHLYLCVDENIWRRIPLEAW